MATRRLEKFGIPQGAASQTSWLESLECRRCLAALATEPMQDLDTPLPAPLELPPGLVLNEIHINPPGANTPYSYVELRGEPGAAVTNAYLLEIEGDLAQNAGRIDSILPINGTLGTNGLMLIRSSAGFAAEDPATTVIDLAQLDAGNPGFEIGSATFVLLAHDPTVAPFGLAVGDDLDPTNAGSLSLPTSVTPIDRVGLLDGSLNDIAYGVPIGPIGIPIAPDAPDAVSRFYDNTTPNTAAAWFWGNVVGLTGDTTTYSSVSTQRSPNFPTNGRLTPGAHLIGLLSASFNYVGQSHNVSIAFTTDVTAGVSPDDFELLNTTTNTVVQTQVASISADGKTVTLSFANTGGVAPNVLKNGDYRLRVKGASSGGGLLAEDYDVFFFFVNADFNHDRAVNFSDLLTLAQNYNNSTNATFAAGDTNYDGVINFADLLTLAQRYGSSLAVSGVTAGTFSSTRIGTDARPSRVSEQVLA